MQDSRRTTSQLKGLAIAVVVFAHFSSLYAMDFYSRWFTEYASAIVAFFFVLSGYGIFFSLERGFEQAPSAWRASFSFACRRLVRIYPLYWLALVTIPLFYMPDQAHYGAMYHSGFRSVLIWMGFPLIRNDELWFITAILQCYWVAPLIYVMMRRLGTMKSLVMVAAGLAGTFLVSVFFYLQEYSLLHLPYIEPSTVVFYRNFFLGNIVLFSLGMAIAPLSRRRTLLLANRPALALLAGATLLLLYSIRVPDLFFRHSELYLMPLFYIALALFCLAAIVNRLSVPPSRAWTFLGDHSYTVYLFHYQLIWLLWNLGLSEMSLPWRVTIVLAVMPPFLLLCLGIEKGAAYPRKRLERLFRSRRPIEAEAPAIEA
ncbi:MAG: acyltransferase family protein [Thermoleophilia bacterium]